MCRLWRNNVLDGKAHAAGKGVFVCNPQVFWYRQGRGQPKQGESRRAESFFDPGLGQLTQAVAQPDHARCRQQGQRHQRVFAAVQKQAAANHPRRVRNTLGRPVRRQPGWKRQQRPCGQGRTGSQLRLHAAHQRIAGQTDLRIGQQALGNRALPT